MGNDAISRSAVLALSRLESKPTYSDLYDAKAVVDIEDIEKLPALDVVQIVTNGQDTTYLRVKSLDGLRGRIVIDEESGNRCAMYYEEAEDFAPVVHARWNLSLTPMPTKVTYDGWMHCPKCRESFRRIVGTQLFKHCPNCSARMDGDADE